MTPMSRDGREQRGGARRARPLCAGAPPPAGARGPGVCPRRRRDPRTFPGRARRSRCRHPQPGADYPRLSQLPPVSSSSLAAPQALAGCPAGWQQAPGVAGTARAGTLPGPARIASGALPSSRAPGTHSTKGYRGQGKFSRTPEPVHDTNPAGLEAGQGFPLPQNLSPMPPAVSQSNCSTRAAMKLSKPPGRLQGIKSPPRGREDQNSRIAQHHQYMYTLFPHFPVTNKKKKTNHPSPLAHTA